MNLIAFSSSSGDKRE